MVFWFFVFISLRIFSPRVNWKYYHYWFANRAVTHREKAEKSKRNSISIQNFTVVHPAHAEQTPLKIALNSRYFFVVAVASFTTSCAAVYFFFFGVWFIILLFDDQSKEKNRLNSIFFFYLFCIFFCAFDSDFIWFVELNRMILSFTEIPKKKEIYIVAKYKSDI